MPAGPFVRVEVLGAGLSLGSGQGSAATITGDFFFDQRTDPGPDGLLAPPNDKDNRTITRIAASNVSVRLGGQDLEDGVGRS